MLGVGFATRIYPNGEIRGIWRLFQLRNSGNFLPFPEANFGRFLLVFCLISDKIWIFFFIWKFSNCYLVRFISCFMTHMTCLGTFECLTTPRIEDLLNFLLFILSEKAKFGEIRGILRFPEFSPFPEFFQNQSNLQTLSLTNLACESY